MSTNSCEGFYGAKLVNRFALHSIKDDPFSHNISKTFGTNVMFFIQADFLVTNIKARKPTTLVVG